MYFGSLINEKMKGGKMKNKKALSDIVATVLIVLLALAAIAIVWSFIRPTIEKTGTSIDLSQKCFEAEVKPIDCHYPAPGTDTAVIKVQNIKGSFSEIVAIMELDDGSTITQEKASGNQLGTVNFQITYSGTPKLLQAAAKVTDTATGQSVICTPSLVKVNCETP